MIHRDEVREIESWGANETVASGRRATEGKRGRERERERRGFTGREIDIRCWGRSGIRGRYCRARPFCPRSSNYQAFNHGWNTRLSARRLKRSKIIIMTRGIHARLSPRTIFKMHSCMRADRSLASRMIVPRFTGRSVNFVASAKLVSSGVHHLNLESNFAILGLR